MATLAQNIQRAIDDFNSIENAIVQKGVPVPDGTPTSQYGEKILSIETGVDTSGDTVVPSALREGYTAHNAAGQEITGTIPNYDGSITEGAVEGAQAKYEEGVADGKQAEYDAFWDAYQKNGERINYNYAFFGDGWTDQSFKPKYDIQIGNASNGAGNGNKAFMDSRISDIGKTLKDRGVVLDTSRCNNLNQMFQNAKTKTLPAISAESANVLPLTFYVCSYLETIQMVIVTERNSFDRTFFACGLLVNLITEGTIGQNGFNVSWSPLNKASITSIINALSSTTTGLTVTIRLAAVNTAFETNAGAADGSSSEEWLNLIATKSNWTINLINS